MYSPLDPDGSFTRKNKTHSHEKIMKDASTAWWFMFVFGIFELALLTIAEWLAVTKTIWPITPIIPTVDDPPPEVRDSQLSWEFTLVNFFIFAWLAPVMILLDLVFWRKNADIMPTISIVVNVLVTVMIIISFAIVCDQWRTCNTPESPDNIFNDAFYCCAYFDNAAAGCPNFGTDCGATILPGELSASMAGVLRFVFTLIIMLAVIGFNILYYHTKFVPTIEVLLAAECYAGYKDDLQKRTSRSKPCMKGEEQTPMADEPEEDYSNKSVPRYSRANQTNFLIPMYPLVNNAQLRQ